jgi:hypothetical protein
MQAKRDPYRFRFPIELRFVDPNIDDMIYCHFSHPLCFQITMMVFKGKELFQRFKVTTPAACSYWIVGFCRFHRFEHPPSFARPGDDDPDEVARESNRPYWPKLRPEKSAEDEEEQGCLVHPAVPRVISMCILFSVKFIAEDSCVSTMITHETCAYPNACFS